MSKQARVWLLGLLLTMATPLWAAFDEGIEYKAVSPRVANHIDDNKIEVVEMFWYGCSHCFAFEPDLQKWLVNKKPSNVNFVRVPATFYPLWKLHAKAYYTAEILGVVEKIHQPLFDAIHLKHKKMATTDELASFFAKYGIDKETFLSTFNSFAVDAKVRRATDLTQRYGIDGVPSLIVNGKYRTSASQAGSRAKMLQVVDHLIQQEAKK